MIITGHGQLIDFTAGRPLKFSTSERYITTAVTEWREQLLKINTEKEKEEWLIEKKAEKAARDDVSSKLIFLLFEEHSWFPSTQWPSKRSLPITYTV